jgi:uncharacterized protein
MATMNQHVPERRHMSERRTTAADSARTGMNALDWVALVLMIIGGLNWGLIGLFNVDLVAGIFGEMSPLSRAIYTAVGLAALYSIYTSSKISHSH